MRHAARPVTVTISATPRAHGLSSKVKNVTVERAPFQLCPHVRVDGHAARRRRAEELLHVGRRAAGDPDPARSAVALDHMLRLEPP